MVVGAGDGTLRKSPDKWSRWSVAPGLANHPIQLAILKQAISLLAPAGEHSVGKSARVSDHQSE